MPPPARDKDRSEGESSPMPGRKFSDSTAELPEKPEAGSIATRPIQAMRLAVVDDYAIMRGVFETLVEDAPDFVMAWTASSVAQARQFLERDVPDLLVMDVGLPDGNGFDFVREILQVRPQLPVLMVSAHDDRSYPQRARDCGAKAYLSKVASLEQVLEVLDLMHRGGTWWKSGK